jgi:hypothetical protein
MIPVVEQAKIVHALEHEATVSGARFRYTGYNNKNSRI